MATYISDIWRVRSRSTTWRVARRGDPGHTKPSVESGSRITDGDAVRITDDGSTRITDGTE